MLTIRHDQTNRLIESSFVDRIAAHVDEYFPAQSQKLGPARLHDFIAQTLNNAYAWGIIDDGHLCQFVTLAVVFGPGFDNDPGVPWAAEILRDETLSPALRMKRLGQAAMEAL